MKKEDTESRTPQQGCFERFAALAGMADRGGKKQMYLSVRTPQQGCFEQFAVLAGMADQTGRKKVHVGVQDPSAGLR